MMQPRRCAALIPFLLLLLLGLGTQASGTQASRTQASEEQDAPTRITSQRLRYSHHDNRIEFIGTVRVDRPGFEMRSERLLVYLQTVRRDESGVANGSKELGSKEPGHEELGSELGSWVEVEKMIAQGNVSLKHGGRVGRGETATYWVDLEVLRLEGNAVVEEGLTRLEGNVFILNVQDEELDVQGGPERRVEGMFFPPQEAPPQEAPPQEAPPWEAMPQEALPQEERR